MATVTVEGVPDALVARLKLAAAKSGRSLNSEVILQLVRSVGCSRRDPVADGPKTAPRCATGGCRCAARRAQTRAVGWGGPVP